MSNMLIGETSERSDGINWVKSKLLTTFNIAEFEGYTVMNNVASALLDRRLIENIEGFDQNNLEEIKKYIVSEETEDKLRAKILFSSTLNCKYSYLLYSYSPEKVFIYNIKDIDNVKLVKTYNRILDFALDLSRKRDKWMASNYEEDGLPVIDKLLRAYNSIGILSRKLKIIEDKNPKPSQYNLNEVTKTANNFRNNHTNIVNASGKLAWPGNLDGLLYDNNGAPRALIEFSTVNKGTVKDHCHNNFFLASKTRKGDEQRWRVFDIMAQQSNLPLIIIVWSPNEIDGNIKYKVVDKIVYSDNKKGEKPGLKYSECEVIGYAQLVTKLNSLLR